MTTLATIHLIEEKDSAEFSTYQLRVEVEGSEQPIVREGFNTVGAALHVASQMINYHKGTKETWRELPAIVVDVVEEAHP